MLFEQLVKYALYAAAVAYLVRLPSLRRTFRALPQGQRRFLAALFGLILLAQVIESKYQSYPFVKWGMYSDSNDRIGYYEYVGVRPDGSEAPFPVARLLRIHQPVCPTCSKRLVWRLEDLAQVRTSGKSPAQRAEATALYERLLRGAWAAYAARHPEQRFAEVRVWRAGCRVADYTGPESIERELAWSVSLRGVGRDAE